MIHVPDEQASVAWYQSIGFTALDIGEVVFALLSFRPGDA